MEVEKNDDHNSGETEQKTNWNLLPVAHEQSGEGLPSAPQDWPYPGDVWGWRTGKRVSTTGHFTDRYLYLPIRLCPKRSGFASKLSLQRYIQDNFPHVSLDDFFDSFSWRIPFLRSGNEEPIAVIALKQLAPEEKPDLDLPSDDGGCKSKNKMCISLIPEEQEKYSPAMPCDICCTEPGFCRDCCCILCSSTVNSDHGGFSYIKCQVNFEDGTICGHVAHLECALRTYMAGTVGGSIGLDAEYYCRRCDGRTCVISHVNKLLQTCAAIDSEDNNNVKEKILTLCFSLLHGSQKAAAKELLSRIKLCTNLKCENGLEDVQNVTTVCEGQGHSDVRIGTKSPVILSNSSKLDTEIDQILKELRKSQEYNLAKDQKYLQYLYLQLDDESSELECLRNCSQFGDLLDGTDKASSREIQRYEEDSKWFWQDFNKYFKGTLWLLNFLLN